MTNTELTLIVIYKSLWWILPMIGVSIGYGISEKR